MDKAAVTYLSALAKYPRHLNQKHVSKYLHEVNLALSKLV
jgi:hypothetical protein